MERDESELLAMSSPPGLSVAVLFFDGTLQTNDWIHGHLVHWKDNVVVKEPVTVVAGFHQLTNPTQTKRIPHTEVSASSPNVPKQNAKFTSLEKTKLHKQMAWPGNTDPSTIMTSLGPNFDMDMEKIARNFVLRRVQLGIKQSTVATTLRSRYGNSFSRTSLCRFEKLQLSRKKFYEMNKILQSWLFETEKGSTETAEGK